MKTFEQSAALNRAQPREEELGGREALERDASTGRVAVPRHCVRPVSDVALEGKIKFTDTEM